jgi:exodeoxyribonuclease V alpha subunit
MNGYSFAHIADAPAADAWRPLDYALAQWVRAHGGSAQLASVAGWASFADGQGDTALSLTGADVGRHGMSPLTTDAVAALRAEPLVGDGASVKPTPFVLEADGRFALWRNHAHELRIAERVRARLGAGRGVAAATLADDLDTLFQGERSAAVQSQRDAVAGIVGRRLFVLTGGPGTGKTTTVLRMLLMLQRRREQPLTIRTAAPTGKAAQRLLQSLRAGKQAMSAAGSAPLPQDWQPLLARIPDTDALTVHRLLGFDPRRNVFTRSAMNPIGVDVVVIDEASMLDIGMLRALLDAVRADATLILVGDADQLTSVAAGSVLMDLVAALSRAQAPERVRLEHSFRATPRLESINAAVRDGDATVLAAAFDAAGTAARRVDVGTAAALRRQLDRWAGELAQLPIRPTLAVSANNADADERQRIGQKNMDAALTALRALAQRQLLCALREEAFGALAVNQATEQRLKRLWGVPQSDVWYPGRAVLIARNDYVSGLFNGDVGLVLADADGSMRVWFETSVADGHIGARGLPLYTLPPHDGAFAITVHKSQGSEYACAAVLLPPDPAHRILSRQLLYTGLSRAQSAIELWASAGSVAAALAQPIRRAGGLAARLT